MPKLIFFLLLLTSGTLLFAQDTLPAFTLRSLPKEKIQVSWVNPYTTLVQLNVQRSYDSLRNYRTVFTSPSPNLPQNGFTDAAPPIQRVFYRIFYVLEGGTYFFSKPQRLPPGYVAPPVVTLNETKFINIRLGDSILSRLEYPLFLKFRDSILHKTLDSLFTTSDEEVVLKRYKKVIAWTASKYIYTNREGYVMMKLPLALQRRYRLIIYDDKGAEIFAVAHIKEPSLILDKANFVHAGWFEFELYEEDKLLERNKFYLPKDF
jgi:hypothetical protein